MQFAVEELVKDMEVTRFIEKAIIGGWEPPKGMGSGQSMTITDVGICWSFDEYMPIEQILLDPKAWYAVGKIKKWKEDEFYLDNAVHSTGTNMPEAKWYMLNMIQQLWDGRTPKQILSTL